MIDKDRMICICNSLDIKEIAECIKAHGFETVTEMVENDHCPMGNKCESCVEEGYENDGYSLAMVLSLVKQGRL
jgi:bacterioferritin-associated ferredoxin